MNLAALKAEIQNDPTAKGYALHLPDSPGRVVELLNAQTETMAKSRMVTARAILAECEDGATILDKLEAAGTSVSAVKWAVRFLGQDAGVDIGHKAARGMIDQLVTGSVLLAGEAGQLKAMAMQPASRAEVLGFGFVHDSDVRDALRA
jgi:hypothetical protein